MVSTLKNYLLLITILIIQTNYVIRIEEHPYMGGNLNLHQELAVLLIYLLPLLRYNQVLDFAAPIALWTIGFMLVFNSEIPTVSGALLISCAGFLDQYIKRTTTDKTQPDMDEV